MGSLCARVCSVFRVRVCVLTEDLLPCGMDDRRSRGPAGVLRPRDRSVLDGLSAASSPPRSCHADLPVPLLSGLGRSRGSCLFVHSCHDRAPFVLFSPLKTGHRRWARTPDEGARRSGAAHPICPVQRSSVLLFPRYPRPRGYPSVSFVSTAPLRKTFYLPLRAAPLLLPPVARPHWPW